MQGTATTHTCTALVAAHPYAAVGAEVAHLGTVRAAASGGVGLVSGGDVDRVGRGRTVAIGERR